MKLRIALFSLLTLCCLMLAVAPAMAQFDLYDNGPYNGTTDAWTINFGFTVSDSYTLPFNAPVFGFSFVYWDANSSDLLTSVDWCTSGAPLCTPNATWGAGGTGNITNTLLGTNQFGYELYRADITGLFALQFANPGFITLGNACTTSGCSVSNPIYWDENSGVGCMSNGCPSSAFENTIGSIPSEAFTVTGGCVFGGRRPCGPTPEPGTITLFGSGILGLAGVLRRKLNT
jgi:PEP-CTERM motif